MVFYRNELLKVFLLIISGLVFFGGLTANFLVRAHYKPKLRDRLDEVYFEFEDDHPLFQKYYRLNRLTLSITTAGLLVFFICAFV